MKRPRRSASVPDRARALAAQLTKADLIEIAWHLASLANEAGSVDDEDSTFERLVAEAQACAEANGVQFPRSVVAKARAANRPLPARAVSIIETETGHRVRSIDVHGKSDDAIARVVDEVRSAIDRDRFNVRLERGSTQG